jgi:hypothetical protein
MQKSRPVPMPAPGYHHLGATTSGVWSGVIARLEVVDAAVRPESFDFVATRLMAKADTPDGTEWLEAGWAETGWSGDGRQRIYSYDTNRDAWAFYDQYEIAPGQRFWVYLQTEQDAPRPQWQAWLWWSDGWHLLTSQDLPLTGRAKIEQYVELHSETPFHMPPVDVDNVSLKDGPKGPLVDWVRRIPTNTSSPHGTYCLTWIRPYDFWTAGSCL